MSPTRPWPRWWGRVCTGTYLGANLIFHNRRNDVGLWWGRPVVTKHITLNLLLPWIATQLPWLRTVQIVRHPLAVVASQEGRAGSYWAETTTLSRPYRRFLEAHGEYDAPLDHASTAEALVTMWAIEHAWLRDNQPRLRRAMWVRYEDLRADPATHARALATWADLPPPTSDVLARIRRPSRSVEQAATTFGSEHDAAWRRRYDSATLDRLRAILERFDLPFYSAEELT